MAVIQVGQPIFPDSQGIINRVGVTYQDWNVLGQFITNNIPTLGSDAFANGAFGDGVHDDTAALQQTFNQTGVLFLRPGKRFLISSTIICPNFPDIFIYGGGYLATHSNITMVSCTNNSNVRIYNIVFTSTAGAGTAISISGNGDGWNEIRGCYLGIPGGTCISLTNLSSISWSILQCVFPGGATGISLNTPIAGVQIVDCFFQTTTSIATSGAVTYNVRGCNILDYHQPQIPRALIYQSVGQVVASGATIVLSFATAAYNIGTTPLWSAGSPTRFTAPVAGNYDVLSGYLYNGASAGFGNFEMAIKINGALTSAPEFIVGMGGPAGTIAAQQIAASFDLNVNDFIEFEINQNSGGALTTTPASTFGMMVFRSQP